MRKINFIVVGLLLNLFFGACTKIYEDNGKLCGSREIIVHAQIENNARLANNSFGEGDEMGIFMVDYVNGSPGILGDFSSSVNVKHTYETNGFWYANAGEEIYIDENKADLYAYFPYDSEIGNTKDKTNLSAYPFEIETDQSASSAKNDILWAKYDGLSNLNNQANIIFKHVLSKLIVNVKFDVENPDVSDFKIHNTKTSSVINLRNGEAMAKGSNNVVTPEKIFYSNEYNLSYEAILVPQIIENGTPMFTMEYNGETLVYETDKTIELLPQKSYIFNLTVGNISRAPFKLKSIEVNSYELDKK